MSFACAAALVSCSSSRPPQTNFYCVDIPESSPADASRFVRASADRLGFKISEAQYPAETGPPNHVWEVYGGGISLFIDTAMNDGKPDRFGNSVHTFNPNRLSLQVVRTGLWQRVRFEEALAAESGTAHQLSLSFTKAPNGNCST